MSDRITAYLTNDHGRLLSLFGEFQDTEPSEIKKRQRRFNRFCREKERHGRWVGDILVSRIEDRVSGETLEKLERMLGREPDQIEEQVRGIREKLDRGEADTSALEQRLLSNLQDHFSKEEQVLYPLLDQNLRDEERKDILDRFDEELAQVEEA